MTHEKSQNTTPFPVQVTRLPKVSDNLPSFSIFVNPSPSTCLHLILLITAFATSFLKQYLSTHVKSFSGHGLHSIVYRSVKKSYTKDQDATDIIFSERH